jgi:hypothetical protein
MTARFCRKKRGLMSELGRSKAAARMAEIGAERKPILRSAASGVAPKADRLEEDRDRPSRVASRRSRIARRVRPWQ